MVAASRQITDYFEKISKQVSHVFEVAALARKKNLDPEENVEISLATNMAERVVGIISIIAPQIINSGVVERIIELEKQYSALDWRVALKIAEEVAKEKFCKFKDRKEAMEIGIRTGFAYHTVGVVSSPLDGIVSIDIKKRMDNKGEYFAINFAGPIRNAGGTAAAVSVIITDYVRKQFGYGTYDATEEEIKRAMTEMQDYREKVAPRQYFPSWEEHEFLMKNLPVEIAGEPSEKIEVSNYKDLPRIPTNFIRSGFALLTTECLPLKAPKLWKQISAWGKDFGLENWFFLEQFLKIQKEQKAKGQTEKKDASAKLLPDFSYLHELVAGRPVLSFPLRHGGLRLRYGRCRTSGFSSCAMNPASMFVVNSYLATGTQIKIERPSKGSAITACDLIEGPVVKLKDNTVLQINSIKQAKEMTDKITEIIYFGDFLVSYGDFFNRAHMLVPAGYCEEWWAQEVEKEITNAEVLQQLMKKTQLSEEVIVKFIKQPLAIKPDAETALNMAKITNTALHPKYTYHWQAINFSQLSQMLDNFQKADIIKNEESIEKIVLPIQGEAKRAFELIGVPHLAIAQEKIVIDKENAAAILSTLGLVNNTVQQTKEKITLLQDKNILEIINTISEIKIKDKGGTFIGARMGRPEKAKMRKMIGSPHTLFPVGEEGGKYRCFQSSLEKGKIIAEFPRYNCNNCRKDTMFRVCNACGEKTTKQYYCKKCGWLNDEKCKEHGATIQSIKREIDIKSLFSAAIKKINMQTYPDLIKGVRGTINKSHIPEHFAKGIIRAKHEIHVNKDGTVRYDMTQLPITHFKPKEIGTSIEKLRELGYEKDINGNNLINEEQILEIKPQDVLLPGNNQIEEEGANKILQKVGNFCDDLLVNFYSQEPFYNFKTEQDTIGHLVVCLAPHTSAAMIGRIIGYTKTQGFFAHPLMHAATRRDCVHPNTKILFFCANNQTHYPKISVFVENLISKGCKTKIIDSAGTISILPDKEYYTYGADPNTKKLVRKKIKYFIKGPPNKKWVRITTTTNREINITKTHDFMYLNFKNEIKFKKAYEVKVGDKLLVANSIIPPLSENIKIDLIKEFVFTLPKNIKNKFRVVGCKQFFKSLLKQSGRQEISMLLQRKIESYRWCAAVTLNDLELLIHHKKISFSQFPEYAGIRYWFSNKIFPRFLELNNKLCRVLGYYAAEGHCRENKTTRQVSFRICNAVLANKLVKCIKTSLNLNPAMEENNTKITISHAVVYYLFKYVLETGSSAKNKKVPSIMYSLQDNLIQEYISGYVDGDCSIVPERNAIVFYSISKSLLDDFALLISRFNIIGRYAIIKERFPGKKILERYVELKQNPKKSGLSHLIFRGKDCRMLASKLKLCHKQKLTKLCKILQLNTQVRRLKLINNYVPLQSFGDTFIDYVKKIEIIEDNCNSYCVEVEWNKKEERSVVWGEQIINTRCDGDEACVMLLLDAFLNFSRQYLPNTRGGTMDAPLVLTTLLAPAEVDDMVFDLDIAWKYPLEFYEAAQNYRMPWDVKIKQLKSTLHTEGQYEGLGFTHGIGDMNETIRCSAYKTLPSMQDKLKGQMDIAEKLRAVDTADVARLVIEKHFLKDIKGNLRKFSSQEFRCVNCNETYRRPPLAGQCTKCKGRIIFTIAEGSVLKYLEPAISIAKKYEVSPYLRQTLDILQLQIESVFGREKEKQTGLGSWFG